MRLVESALQAAVGSWLLAYLLNSLWQIPLVFCAALFAARLARPAGPQMEHRVWVTALALEAILPVCDLHVGELWGRAWGPVLWFSGGGVASGQTRVVLGAGAVSSAAVPWLSAAVFAALAVAYVCGLLYFIGRLGWGVWRTENLRRGAVRLEPDQETATKIARLHARLCVGPGQVKLASSPGISGPAAVGIRRPTVLLPPGFLDKLNDGELDALLAHEFAHVQRRDFAKNLLYGVLSLPAAYHPLVSLTRTRLAETRELVCDARAAEAVGGREGYARSLLRLASMLSDRNAPRILHAIGILDANIFERRVMQLTHGSLQVGAARRFAIVAACTLVAFLTCGSALALRMDVTTPSPNGSAPSKVHVRPSDLTVVNKVPPDYPIDAKKDHVTGKVILAATIGKDGAVEQLKVTKSLRADCDKSAIDAVKQWRYKPFLLNGEPVKVDTTVTIVYRLGK